MPCNYLKSGPVIKTYFSEKVQLDALCHLTAHQLNEVYDQLDWDPWPAASNEEERSNKSKLIAWILRNMPELKHATQRMQTKRLIEESMVLRGGEGEMVVNKDEGARALCGVFHASGGGGGGGRGGDGGSGAGGGVRSGIAAAPPRKGRACKKSAVVVVEESSASDADDDDEDEDDSGAVSGGEGEMLIDWSKAAAKTPSSRPPIKQEFADVSDMFCDEEMTFAPAATAAAGPLISAVTAATAHPATAATAPFVSAAPPTAATPPATTASPATAARPATAAPHTSAATTAPPVTSPATPTHAVTVTAHPSPPPTMPSVPGSQHPPRECTTSLSQTLSQIGEEFRSGRYDGALLLVAEVTWLVVQAKGHAAMMQMEREEGLAMAMARSRTMQHEDAVQGKSKSKVKVDKGKTNKKRDVLWDLL